MTFLKTQALTLAPVCLALVAFLAMPGEAQADQVVVGGIDHAGAKIIALEGGKLTFRSREGMLRDAWIDEVDLIFVDRGGAFDDFNQAERFLAAGKPDRAIARYRRTLRLLDEFWPDLVAARLLIAYDAAGRFEDAVQTFIRVISGAGTGTPTASRLLPNAIPLKRNGKVTRSLERILNQLRGSAILDDAQQTLFLLLRYEILRVTKSKGAGSAAAVAARTPIPEAVRSDRVYAILLSALHETLRDGADPGAMESLDTAIRACPGSALPGFLLLKGRTMLREAATREEIIRAAWPLLRVVIHFGNDPITPEALYESAVAAERINRSNKAVQLLTECLVHPRVTEETTKLATVAMKRLQSTAADAD